MRGSCDFRGMALASAALEALGPATFSGPAHSRSQFRSDFRVEFVPGSEVSKTLDENARQGFLPVLLPAPKPGDRGHLALLIEEAVEVALERHGGSPPGLSTEADLEASLTDQLYRARLLEFRGLAIAVGPLTALVDAAGVLDLEDSAALRFFAEAPKHHPVRLIVDRENALVGVYGPPRPLGDMVSGTEEDQKIEGPVAAGDLARALVVALTDAASSDEVPLGEPAAATDASAVAEPASTPQAPEVSASEPPLFTEEAPETSQIRPAPLGPLHERAHEAWPQWLRELEGARGPKPLGSVERMFAKSY